MKKVLNTLYVTSQGAYLCRDGETVLVRVSGSEKLRVPIHNLESVVCFGQVSCSPPLLGLCGERGVTVSFLSVNGRFLARVQGPVSGNVLLRREQYRRADDERESAGLSYSFLSAKIANARTVLMRAVRDRPDSLSVGTLSEGGGELDRIGRIISPKMGLETLRGMEGDASRIYFGVFDHLVTSQKTDFYFHGRSRRPPRDNLNALLSFVYTLLAHDCCSALEGVGLDPQVGFLHRDRPGRPSLALDLMEELRPVFGDRLALTLINRQQIKGKGFRRGESGGVTMDDGTRKSFIAAYQKRKQDLIHHPFIEENVQVGQLFHIQALLLSRHLRGDLDAYPPFFWK